ncbi:DUF2742 domain-containing protein [Streptomyces heilongjiangensis]|uniref:DUF2742 domain-containing protein n=1 Tax=Streptomyces heilongjiangensis TaxID=945052 RepID=A0ABW1B5J6_9ACTN|nr:DUF2742 domain-containing protein [Streptomyces heilongjiangensis]MDC2951761.1 DUF2742 domain-containing protein [Streptomyces heilongjiangensis]
MTTRTPRTRLANTAGRVRLHTVPPDATAGQATHLRACAQAEALRVTDWPEYGSPAWLRLPADDPRVYVATLEAAELHRMHVERLYADAHTQALNTLQTAAEVRAARKGTSRTRAPHKLTPTPGWPPIQIPGRPGAYLTMETSE